MELGELITCLDDGAEVRGDIAGVRVGDVTEDSRTVLPGSLFVARAGVTHDGRAFVGRAIADGAVAVLTDEAGAGEVRGVPAVVVKDPALACALMAERFYGEPSRVLRLAGITGTNGKTTTAHIAHAVLNGAGQRSGLIGTVEIDDGLERAPAEMTTMPALELSRTLAVMREQGCVGGVMEVSSHALHQKRVAGLELDVGVFTNLTPEHLDYHGTIESYAEAKSALFDMLGPGATAVVNADDPLSERMIAGCDAEVVRCSARGAGSADCEVAEIDRAIDGTLYELSGPWGRLSARVPLVGEHNGMNLLQGCCIAWSMGVDAAGLESGLRGVTPPPGRMEFVSSPGAPVTVIVDYAHTDDALERVLSSVRPLVPGRLWVVFGAGGNRDREKRPRMGAVVARRADEFVITSDNPRREDPSEIVGEVVRGVPEERREAMRVHVDRAQAIGEAIAHAEPGDVVLIAGKGHETTQTLPDGRGGVRVIEFDDRVVARRALASGVC